LQLEAEQIDQVHMNTIAEDRLKYINKILKGQLDELQQEIAQVEFPFKMQLNLPPTMPLSPKRLLQHLAENIRAIKRDTSRLREELRAYQNFTVLKASLKGYRIPKGPSFEKLDESFFDGFEPPSRFR
jgi:vacuolar-type H+-ATPase subunit I/STV1